MTFLSDSTSATYPRTFDINEPMPDSGTSTPKQRPWQGKVARLAIAATMLASQGTSVLAELPGNTVQQVDDSSAQPIRLAQKTDYTTMNDITKQPNLQKYFVLEDVPITLSFLRDNPFLFDILLGSYYSAQNWFGKDARLRLQVFSNPENVGQARLRIMIRTRLSVDEALDRLTQLYENWFFGILPMTRDKLLIDVETM